MESPQAGVANQQPGETEQNENEEEVAVRNAGRLLQDADEEYQIFQETISVASSDIDTASVFNEQRRRALIDYYQNHCPVRYKSPEGVDDLPRDQRPKRLVPLSPIIQLGQMFARTVGEAFNSDYIRNMANVEREADLTSMPSSADSNARFVNRGMISELPQVDPWLGLGPVRGRSIQIVIPDANNKLPHDVQAYISTPNKLEDYCRYVMAYDTHGVCPKTYYPDFSSSAQEWLKQTTSDGAPAVSWIPELPIQPCLTKRQREAYTREKFKGHRKGNLIKLSDRKASIRSLIKNFYADELKLWGVRFDRIGFRVGSSTNRANAGRLCRPDI